MSGTLSDLAAGAAQRLAGKGIGSWSPDGAYTASQVGHMIGVELEAPDQIISSSPYVVSDETQLADSVVGLHILLRGDRDPRTVLDRAAAIFDELHGLERVELGGVYVVLMWRQADRPLRPDTNQRTRHLSTYYARVAWPTQHRTD